MGSFYSLWEDWEVNDRRDKTVESQLDGAYREVWESGDDDDRFAVLYFVFERRDANGYDLILDGLGATDRLASHAAAMAISLILDGVDLGPTIRERLETLTQRFPDSSFAFSALDVLDGK